MRLNPFDPNNIRVTEGSSGFPGGGGGKLGCGTLVIALIGAVVFGVDPGQMIGAIEGTQQQVGPSQSEPITSDANAICNRNAYALESCNALDSLNRTWSPLFQKANIAFEQPTLHFYQGGTGSGCGAAQSAMGPFYCPADQGIYIDTSFYDQLDKQLGAGGDFARYYVIAHEYGHHVQKLTGIADQVRSAQQQAGGSQANALQVRMELQADCYAGVWAGQHRDLIEAGDMEEGLTAASAIGDDTLQRSAGQQVSPESFTHGSSAQRMQWLKRGLETGNDEACDTFADLKS
ncbi:putative metalloprotease [Novosphingobium chloroacetimidivorans]|uniref:Putative metalloprotease n=1 Tax=Novosphingobium chloroacetimidivorans TaxID=1428314 RepID=A0A7W7NXS2_9SPHN|nr:neutral zinc metallopeptidase [Novosphingobium chloroacetimidivorans]MBB4859759.1 putative metalloprotease [Novosphingobium chloroacetimidivorans]